MSLYPLFGAKEIDKNCYIDGGISNNLPVEPLKKRCDKVIGINLNPLREFDYASSSFLKRVKRVLFLLFYANISVRIEECDVYYEPKYVSKFSILNTKCLRKCYDEGYRYAKEESPKTRGFVL
jgi:NTE family protein